MWGDRGAIWCNTFARFSDFFPGWRSTFETSIVISRGRRSTLDVTTLHFLRCEVVDFGVHEKTCSYKAWHELLVLRLQHFSPRFSGFLVASPCQGGKLQNLSFWKISNEVKIQFCVAGVTLCDIAASFITCQKACCVTGAILLWGFQKVTWIFWQVQHFGDLNRHLAWQVQHFLRVVLRVFRESHCQGCMVSWRCKKRVAGVGHREGLLTLYIPHSTLYTLHSTLTLCALYFTPHTLLLTPHILALHTLHSTLYSLRSTHYTLYTPHSTLHTLHTFTLCTPHYTRRSTLYTYTPPSTLYASHFTLDTLHTTLYTLTLDTSHSTLCTWHSTLCTWHSTLYTWHSTLHILHFTVHTLHSTVCTGTVTEELDDGWPKSEKDVFQAARRMVVVKDSRWMVGEFYMSYGGIRCEK